LIDVPTLIGYSAVLFALIGGLFLFFWFREGRSANLIWFGLPFLMAVFGAAFLVRPALLPGTWGLRLGALFIMLAYGFGWQAVRAFYSRPLTQLYVVLPTFLWLGLAATVFKAWDIQAVSAAMRALIVAVFTGLSAREFWLSREENLPSRSVLFWIFATYCAYHIARIPFSGLLPEPLGSGKTEVWAVVTFNVLAVTQALAVTAFMIAMSRERISMRNYQMALRDALTGAYNRRAYLEHMQAFDSGVTGSTLPFSLLLLDIDRFKSINDQFGHEMGDQVIKLAARAAEAALRKNDAIFRVGGEEFVCILPGTDMEEAYEAAERVRFKFQAMAGDVDRVALNATISIGAASSDGKAELPNQVFARADKALYEAKQAGRNRTVKAGPAPQSEDEAVDVNLRPALEPD
jgi:diguanylate cyclase (GGDEF)-like protein